MKKAIIKFAFSFSHSFNDQIEMKLRKLLKMLPVSAFVRAGLWLGH